MSSDDNDDDSEMAEAAQAAASADDDFFDHEPSKQEKVEMRKANKPPSEWLRLLCKDWATENEDLVDATDDRFLDYKSYLKGLISSQLLVKLSVPPIKDHGDASPSPPPVDFWGILGIEDDFDKSYIVAQVERFCSLYSIRAPSLDDVDGLLDQFASPVDGASAIAAAGISVSPSGGITLPPYMDPNTAATISAAAAVAVAHDQASQAKLTKKQAAEVSKAHKMAKDAEKALEAERRQTIKREQRRLSMERKEQRSREREAMAVRKASERAAREATREERRRKKMEMRMQRERFAQEQKNAALKRAAELVQSNRVPIEITRGAAAAKAAASAAMGVPPELEPPHKKSRSSIVVSSAHDLHQIVTHSRNLWTKYNAIAKEHNQKVNWITVARELGIHVKVREKYARMHSRAEQRGFDWEKNGHFKIKDYPHIFLEPTQAEQKAKMPPPHPDPSTTILVDAVSKEPIHHHHHQPHHHNPHAAHHHHPHHHHAMTEDVVATAAAAAAVVDATVKVEGVIDGADESATAAAVAATLVADPTAGIVDHTLAATSDDHQMQV